jgi:hypothetical protein
MMMTLMMCLVTVVSFGQKDYDLKDNVYYITFESGIGEKIPMEFSIDSFSIAEIQKTKIFKSRGLNSYDVVLFLGRVTSNASSCAENKLKNRSSYTPINGRCYIYCINGSVLIGFHLKGQNGYGNFIIKKLSYHLSWVDDKEREYCFLED